MFGLLEQTADFLLADRILMYHSLPDELPTLNFLRKWSDRKKFYLPRVSGVNLDILPYDEQRLELGAFHIEEPTGNDTVDISHIELIVVPAVAFDRKGNRLGRGKGYYDRLLVRIKGDKSRCGLRIPALRRDSSRAPRYPDGYGDHAVRDIYRR